jgi:phospholipid transport system substrate-binding protein
MSRRSLGRNARTYSNRLEEFTPLFVDFLEHAYMGILEENGEAKIQYDKEIIDGKFGEIDTRAKLKNSKEYGVNYKLYQSLAGWRAYDVVVEGISIVNNYRAQFDRILSKKSFDGLLQDLRDKKAGFKE